MKKQYSQVGWRLHGIALATVVTGTALAWGGCGGGGTSFPGDGGLSCSGGATPCGTTCVETQNDPANCGACGNACPTGQVCSIGKCGMTCLGGYTACTVDAGTTCVDTMNDPANCGACATACQNGQVCSTGKCGEVCLGGSTLCGDLCVETMNDPANCGACGDACPSGQVCSTGECGEVCLGGSTLCGNLCVETMSDPNNCGSCGTVCPGPGNDAGPPEVCSMGTCSVTCLGGSTLCVPEGGVPTCVETASDPDNCGACGNACPTGQVCSNGACGVTCLGGSTLCTPDGGVPTCVATASDPRNCGGCGSACPAGQVCWNGACGLTCLGGSTLCIPDGGAPICVETANDPDNCGGCGNACPAGQVCSTSTCSVKCLGGSTLCGALCVETASDPNNCGACNTVCAATQECLNGVCGEVCLGGSTLCGALCVDTASDPDNCGACNAVCGPYANASATCINSVCQEICDPGTLDCSATGKMGCDTLEDATNSGACAGVPVSSFWFEGTYVDNGTAGNTLMASVSAPAFVLGYSGEGLSVTGASDQYAARYNPTGLPLGSAPRTLEAWVQPAAAQIDTTYNGILAYGTAGVCSQGMLLSMTNAFQVTSANWCNDLLEPAAGPADAAGTWSHFAYTFDGTTRTLYLDGVSVATDVPAAFSTASLVTDALRVGTTDWGAPGGRWFTGVIDEARIYDYARTSAQVLDDATLTARYSFDGPNPANDVGVNHITALVTGATVVPGHTLRAMSFNGGTTNVAVPSLTSLGVSNKAFSIEMWVNAPAATLTSGATLAHARNSAALDGRTSFLGIAPGGFPSAQIWNGVSNGATAFAAIPADTWVHLGETWSTTNGLRLYVDGVQVASTPILTYAASGEVDTAILGNVAATNCGTSTVPNLAYTGLMDSVEIYSRERTPGEIQYDAAN